MSVMSVSTRAVPSGSRITRAVLGTSMLTRIAEATPMPISHSPSRRAPFSRRSFQPKLSAPRVRQSASRLLLNGRPEDGSFSGMFRSRNSTGSMPAACASSSIAASVTGTPIASPGARIDPAQVMFRRPTWWPISRFSPS